MGKKRTVESCGAIKTSTLRRLGLLAPGEHSEGLELSRPDCGGRSLMVDFHLDIRADMGTLRLMYEVDPISGSFQPEKPERSKSRHSRAAKRPRKRAPEVVPPKVAMDYKVELVATRCQFGGVRWWFICPLDLDGVKCGRRVQKLFLPSKGRFLSAHPPRYFGCRACHELTYTSTQNRNRRVDAAVRSGGNLIALADIQGGSRSGLSFSRKLRAHQKRLDDKRREKFEDW
jgi:hypothetical protein